MQTHKEENEEWFRLGLADQGRSYKPLNLSVEQKRRQKTLLNGHWPECVLCNKPTHETGGQQLVATSSIKILTTEQPDSEDSNTHCIEIDTDKYVVLKGSKWTQESIDRVVYVIKSGYLPWFCQVCAGKVCQKCGNPTQWLQGADLLNGNHCGLFPINPGCRNRDCENHKLNWRKQY